MAKVVIDQELCKGCKLCFNVCPQKLLQASEEINSKGYNYATQVYEEKCTACKLCAIMCPESVIDVYK